MEKGFIGIAGGMGPDAGIAMSKNIVLQTIAKKDQEHLPQILYSFPESVPDRTKYIIGETNENPAYPISDIFIKMESVGVRYAAMACNSAHAPQIFNVIVSELTKHNTQIRLFHMIEEVGKFIKNYYPVCTRIGILGTTGTYRARQYDLIRKYGLQTVNISEKEQEAVHNAIYHPDYGVKPNAGKINNRTLKILHDSIISLTKKGAKLVVLGCTELPLVFNQPVFNDIPVIDSSVVVARALIKAHSPEKLKPWNSSVKQ